MGQALEMCVRCENKRGCDLCADLHEWIMEHLEMENELKAYEDTGMEPCEYAAMREAMEKGERAKEYLLYMSHIIRNIGLDRVMELIKAEQDGRLVVLPCGSGAELERDG